MRSCKTLMVVPLLALIGFAAAGGPTLGDAVKEGNATTVRALLKQGVDVNAPEADGTTALHWAARRDDAAIVGLLLDARANANAKNRYGMTPLMLAATNGNVAAIERLLKAGADAKAARPNGETVLMTAARTGNAAAVKILLANGADVNARETSRGQTALMWASSQNNAAAVQLLVEAGADVKARSMPPPSRRGETTVEKKEADAANVDAYSVGKRDRVDSFTPLLFAVRRGALDVVKVLVDAGADVNDSLEDGMSALTLAAINAHWELGTYLLDKGADVNADKQGWTALHQVARTRTLSLRRLPHPVPTGSLTSFDFAKALLSHGANVNARVKKNMKGDQERGRFITLGSTPLVLAAKGFDPDMMRLLLASGADIKITNVIGTNALMAAAGCDVTYPEEDAGPHEDALAATMVALEAGIDINATNEDGNTALHGAAFIGAVEVVQYLVDKGANLQAVNNKGKGWTPLQTAHLDWVGGVNQTQPSTTALLRKIHEERGLPVVFRTPDDVIEMQNTWKPAGGGRTQ